MSAKAFAFQELSSTQVANLEAGRYLVVWPVASLEQHGPHLPLGTDALVLQAIVDGARQSLGPDFPAIFLPLLPLGKSPEHQAFPGTVSLGAVTLLSICNDLVDSLSKHGFKRFVFLNGHGGNTALLQSYGYDLRQKYHIRVYNLDLWASAFFDDIIALLFPELIGMEVHAGSVETALMMHIYPHLVGQLPDVSAPPTFGLPIHACWSSDDFEAYGVIGNPSQASPEKGELIFEYAVKRVLHLLGEIARTEAIV